MENYRVLILVLVMGLASPACAQTTEKKQEVEAASAVRPQLIWKYDTGD